MGDALEMLGMSTQELREEVAQGDPPRGLRRAPETARNAADDMFPWRHDLGLSEAEAVAAVASGRFRPSGGGSSSAALTAARRLREEMEAALVEADRAGSSWPAEHGDDLLDMADALAESAVTASPRRRPSGACAEALGLA
jgi:hypothetical protein